MGNQAERAAREVFDQLFQINFAEFVARVEHQYARDNRFPNTIFEGELATRALQCTALLIVRRCAFTNPHRGAERKTNTKAERAGPAFRIITNATHSIRASAFRIVTVHPARTPFAQRAWIRLAVAIVATGGAYAASYFPAIRKILEQPDIYPGLRTGWLRHFGDSFETAIVRLSVRSLLRSRQHRMIFVFYLGVGFALAILFLSAPPEIASPGEGGPWESLSVPLLAFTVMLMGPSRRPTDEGGLEFSEHHSDSGGTRRDRGFRSGLIEPGLRLRECAKTQAVAVVLRRAT